MPTPAYGVSCPRRRCKQLDARGVGGLEGDGEGRGLDTIDVGVCVCVSVCQCVSVYVWKCQRSTSGYWRCVLCERVKVSRTGRW